MSHKSIKTRFAPSPTGDLHIGGLRTALFAYLFAKKNNGQFFLRIEDTDQDRYKEGSVESILEGLKWAGLKYDNEIIYQSKRTEVYQKYAAELIEKGHAYYCFCTPEDLEKMRTEQSAGGHNGWLFEIIKRSSGRKIKITNSSCDSIKCRGNS